VFRAFRFLILAVIALMVAMWITQSQ